ncbi:MAG TPA: DUF4112 domain-containing protein [Verrucomicrobiales bacterium]|nr:DUF4112 domain-containing protein [Verrucomicrobiales bacterium]
MSQQPGPVASTAEDNARPIEIDAILPPESAGAGPASSPRSSFARTLAYLLDDAIPIPGTKRRIGLDPIIGFLFPLVGDALTASAGSALVVEGIRRGLPRRILIRMSFNILLNATLGSVPLIGDLFSAWYKSNAQNYALLARYSSDPSHPLVRPKLWPLLVISILAVLSIITSWILVFLAVRFILSHWDLLI